MATVWQNVSLTFRVVENHMINLHLLWMTPVCIYKNTPYLSPITNAVCYFARSFRNKSASASWWITGLSATIEAWHDSLDISSFICVHAGRQLLHWKFSTSLSFTDLCAYIQGCCLNTILVVDQWPGLTMGVKFFYQRVYWPAGTISMWELRVADHWRHQHSPR